MRILSISTEENKRLWHDFIMHNGNVLIAQGIELSKRVSKEINNEELYNVIKTIIKFIMDKMNSEDEKINIPKFIKIIKEVTDDNNYKNHQMAKEMAKRDRLKELLMT